MCFYLLALSDMLMQDRQQVEQALLKIGSCDEWLCQDIDLG